MKPSIFLTWGHGSLPEPHQGERQDTFQYRPPVQHIETDKQTPTADLESQISLNCPSLDARVKPVQSQVQCRRITTRFEPQTRESAVTALHRRAVIP